MLSIRNIACSFAVALLVLNLGTPRAMAEDMSVLDEDVHAAIAALKNASPTAVELAKNARGLLIFPAITKAGFVIGAEYGQGALVKPKQGGGYYIDGHYSIKAASYGMQAGVQSYGFALMLMNDAAVEQVETSAGWDLGVGPSIVIVDQGTAKTLTAQTAGDDVYAFTFGQKGLMAGLGLRGSKISSLD
jgi:lipid-binding SYLF domain-containing protein